MLHKLIKRQGKIFLSLFLTSVMLLASRPLFAEPYVGLFLGGTIPADVDFKETFPGLTIKVDRAEVDSSVAGGVKLGYWIDRLPYLGFESSFDLYSADVPRQVVGGVSLNKTDVFVGAWGLTLMGRLPLEVSKQYPRGRFHPYVGVGPGIFFVTGERGGGEDLDTTVGLQVLAGFKAFLTRELAFFLEYKFNAFTTEFDVRSLFFGNGKDELKYRINTVVVGIAVHFSTY